MVIVVDKLILDIFWIYHQVAMNGHKFKFRKSVLRTGPKCWLCLIVMILLISLFISLAESIRKNRIRPKVRGRGRGSRWW